MSAIQIEANKFLRNIPEKHPHLRGLVNQALIDAVVAEMKAIGIFREDVVAQSFEVGLLAAMENGRLPKAPVQVQVIERVIEKQSEPKKLTSRQIQESTGVGTIGGRRNHAHPEPIPEDKQKILIAATELSARSFVENTLRFPPGGENHAVKDRVRESIGKIIREEESDPIARWARTAARINNEILHEFERSIR